MVKCGNPGLKGRVDQIENTNFEFSFYNLESIEHSEQIASYIVTQIEIGGRYF